MDEDTQARSLVRLLRADGHDVLTAEEAGLNSRDDREVLVHARAWARVVLTQNCRDFLALHGQIPDHAGILAVFHDRDASKDMSREEIARATRNVEAAGVEVAEQFLVLNAWRW